LTNWLVNEDCHGFQLVGWNCCCDNDLRILIVKVCRICLIAREESERKWIVHHFVVLIIIIGEILKGMSFLIFGLILLYCRGREIVWMFCFRIGLNSWFNDAKWHWMMLFLHENKLEVEKDFQGMKIVVVQNFSYKGGAIMIVDFDP